MLWRPETTAAAILSMGDALECALRIPGAVGAVLGDLSDPEPLSGQTPAMPAGFALASARSPLAYARRGAEEGGVPEEIMITGATFSILQQTGQLPDGRYAYAQVTLVREHANPALAQIELRRILHHLPGLLPQGHLPRRARREHVHASHPSESVPISLLERVLERLRAL